MEMNPTFQAYVTLHITLSPLGTQAGTRCGHAAIDTENHKFLVFQWSVSLAALE